MLSTDVAVTYSWNRMAYVINKSLSEKGIKVHTGDVSKYNINTFSLLNNKSFVYDNFYDSNSRFVESLLKYMHNNRISMLIPTHEELFIISKYHESFKDFKTLVPEFDNLKIAHKKDQSTKLANDLGIPIPYTFIPQSETDCFSFFKEYGKPVVLKYQNSNSSKGVFYIDSMEQFTKHYINLGQFLLQEYVTGVGYGVSMLYNNGNLRATFTHKRLEEKIATGGTSTLRISTHNDDLEYYAKKILDNLSWNGVAMVEFKWDEVHKKGYFIEINPRFWGSLALPFYSGMDFPWHYYRILKDGDIDPVINYKTGVKVKWLLGGALSFIDGLAHERKLNWKLLSLKADFYDDFNSKDPFILVGEMAYYIEKFIKSRQLNPTKNSTLNIDEI